MGNWFKKLFGGFGSDGLKHSTEHLSNIQRDIAHMSLPEQSKYADELCVNNISNQEWVEHQMSTINPHDPSIFGNVNATAIGNLAYVALHAQNPIMRDKAALTIQKYREWLEQFEA